jgi:hypothetical protein
MVSKKNAAEAEKMLNPEDRERLERVSRVFKNLTDPRLPPDVLERVRDHAEEWAKRDLPALDVEEFQNVLEELAKAELDQDRLTRTQQNQLEELACEMVYGGES